MRWISILVLLFPIGLQAGSDNFHIGGRSAGMAHASVSLSDMWSVHHNQAGLAHVEIISAGIYYENRFLLPELGLKGGIAVIPTTSGVFGVEIASFGYTKYGESKFGLAYARGFGDNFSFGLQLDYLQTRIADNYGTKGVFAVEAGVRARLLDGLHIGAHIFNPSRAKITEFVIDSIANYEERTPVIMRVGFDYRFSEKVFVALETEKDIDQKAMVKVGLEYHISAPLYLRVGISSRPFLNSFGFGLKLNKFHFDFASSFHSVLGYSPQLSISYDIK